MFSQICLNNLFQFEQLKKNNTSCWSYTVVFSEYQLKKKYDKCSVKELVDPESEIGETI